MSQIEGAGVLITGAASGLGRRLAIRMAELGGRLVLWDLDRGRLAEAAGGRPCPTG